jgi:ABC-2 type transport system ATP-binding protein
LSGGTRQKLNDQGFDQDTYLNFWQQVFAWRDAGRAVVVVTHLLHDLQNVDHVLDLGEGGER